MSSFFIWSRNIYFYKLFRKKFKELYFEYLIRRLSHTTQAESILHKTVSGKYTTIDDLFSQSEWPAVTYTTAIV